MGVSLVLRHRRALRPHPGGAALHPPGDGAHAGYSRGAHHQQREDPTVQVGGGLTGPGESVAGREMAGKRGRANMRFVLIITNERGRDYKEKYEDDE